MIFVAWAPGFDKPGLAITQPFDGKPATVGNGVMVALEASSPAEVDRIYKKAIELGATRRRRARPTADPPVSTPATSRDLDGNKLTYSST